MRYRNYGITPDRQTALVMMGAILSDTKNLQSGSTTYADRVALKELSHLAGVKDVDAFYRDMYEASLSYKGMTDEESARDLADRMQEVFPSVLASTSMDMAFAQINVFHDDVSL